MNVLHKTRCSADLKISAFEKQGGEVRFPDNPFYNIQVNGKYDEKVFWISKTWSAKNWAQKLSQVGKAFEKSSKNEFWTIEKDFLWFMILNFASLDQ